MDAELRLRRTRRALLVATSLWLSTTVAVFFRWRGPAADAAESVGTNLLADPALREQAVTKLVAAASNLWDTFPDPDVGRVLQPNMDRKDVGGVSVVTNDFGMREKRFDRPKKTALTRVVLLGDSFILGHGIEAEDRLGAFLADYFTKNKSIPTPVECLHFGATGWNTISETSFLKRCLSIVQPDLVIQLLIHNDLEDSPGARGFGALGRSDPRHGERGEFLFTERTPRDVFHRAPEVSSWIADGLDWESRTRFEDAGRRVKRLADLVERAGGRYLLVDYYVDNLPGSRHYITSKLRPEQFCYLTSDLDRADEKKYKVDKLHWNRAGNELVAKALYELIRKRGLLPKLGLKEWPEATAVSEAWLPRGDEEAAEEDDGSVLVRHLKIDRAIDFTRLDGYAAAQITGGVDADLEAGPYVSLIVAEGDAKRVTISGRGLGRVELDGTTVEVWVEEVRVGSFVIDGGKPIQFAADVPPEVAGRKYATVRLIADDYAYSPRDLRQHVVFKIERVAFE
jgi:lysophospholipase L1-like esterase